ncbi:MAG: hypothetical protein V1494_01990 [Candidatus Diapherotrites archaeon]
MMFPKIDLKELEEEKKMILEERASFPKRYAEYFKTHPNVMETPKQRKLYELICKENGLIGHATETPNKAWSRQQNKLLGK